MKITTIRNIILIFILVVFSSSVGYWLGYHNLNINLKNPPSGKVVNVEEPSGKNIDFSLFWDVWGRLERNYLDKTKLDPQQMVYGAISGMVSSLGDPYTVFLPPQEQKEAKEELGGTFEGIGAQLGMKDKKIIVVAPLKDTPADLAGIKAGDWIVKVDGNETFGWSVQTAVNKIRGPKGSTVVLSILHEGEEKTKDVTLTRSTILVHSVEWQKTSWRSDNGKYVQDDECLTCTSLAYLKLTRFGDQTNSEWEEAVTEISDQLGKGELRGVIFDLRNNPGGYLQGAVFIASEFLKPGSVVVQQEYSTGKKESYSVTRNGKLVTAPLVVVMNKGSASASEIVAGALRDYNRATLVGEKTFGKGSIQEAQELAGGSGLHITIARWLLPKGDWINSKGVDPQVSIVQNEENLTIDTQLEEAANVLLKT